MGHFTPRCWFYAAGASAKFITALSPSNGPIRLLATGLEFSTKAGYTPNMGRRFVCTARGILTPRRGRFSSDTAEDPLIFLA